MDRGEAQIKIQAEHLDRLDADSTQVESQDRQCLTEKLGSRSKGASVIDEANDKDDERG